MNFIIFNQKSVVMKIINFTFKSLLVLVFLTGVTIAQAVTITGVKIVDSATDTEVGDLTEGATLDANLVDTWNFRILTDPSDDNGGGKVVTTITAPDNTSHTQSEGGAPFAAFGDAAGDYAPWSTNVTLMNGDYTLVSYLDVDEAGTKVTINFKISNVPGTDPVDPPKEIPAVYPGKPWNGTPATMPGSTLLGWQYDINGDTLSFASDDQIVCGIIDSSNTDGGGGNPRAYPDQIPQANLRWNFGRQTFRGGGQWAKYTVQILYPGYYNAKVRSAIDYTGDVKIIVQDFDYNNLDSITTSDIVADFVEGEQTSSGGNTRWMTSKDSMWLEPGVQVIYIENTWSGGANGNFGEFEMVLTEYAASKTYMGIPFFTQDGGFQVPFDTIPSAFFDKGDSGVAYAFAAQGQYEAGEWRKQDSTNSYYWYDAGVQKTRFGVNEQTDNTRYGTMKYDNGFKLRYTVNVMYPGEYYSLFRVHANAFRNHTFRIYKIDDMGNPIVEDINRNPKTYTPGGGDGTFEKNPYTPEVLKVKVWDSIPMVMPNSFSDLSYKMMSYNTDTAAGNNTLGYAASGGVSVTRWNTKINFPEAGLYVVEWDFANGGSGALSSFGDFFFVPASDSEAPTAVANVMTVDSTQEMVTIKWDASTDNFGVVTYEVWLEGKLLMKTGTKTMAVIDGLDCGSALDLEIRAVDQSGNYASTNYMAYNHICQGPFNPNNVPVIPGYILATEFDVGGREIAYHDLTDFNSGANKTGDYRPGTAVDIAADFFATKGIYNIGWVSEGEWLEYTLDSIEAGLYTLTTGTSSPDNAGGGFDIYLGEPTEGTNLQLIDSAYYFGGSGWATYVGSVNPKPIAFDAHSRVVMRIAPFDTSSANGNIGNLVDFTFEKIEDTDDPTVPGTISYVDSSHTWIMLAWEPGTDANGVKAYNIYVDGEMAKQVRDTIATIEGLDCNTSYDITIEAVDFYDKVSTTTSGTTVKTVTCQEPYTLVGRESADSIFIELEEFDLGGQGYAFESNRTAYAGDGFRGELNIELYTNDPDDAGNPALRLRTGQWYEWTLDTLKTGYYKGVARYEGGGTWVRQNKVFIGDGPFGENFEQVGNFAWPGSGGWNGTYITTEFYADLVGGDDVVLRMEPDNNLNVNWMYLVYIPDAAAPVMTNDMLQQVIKLPDSVSVTWESAIEDVFIKYYEVQFNGGDVYTTKDTVAGFGGLAPENVYEFKVRAVDAELKTSDWITINLESAGSQFPYMSRVIKANPDTIIVFEAEHFDNGGLNAAYFDDLTRVGDALDFRPFEYVDLEYNDDSTMTYVVDIRNGEYLEFALDTIVDGLYDVKFNINQLNNGKVVMSMGDAPLGENFVSLDTFEVEGPTGGFNTEIVESWWFSGAENKVIRFEFLDADSLLEFDWFSFTYVPDTVKPEKPVVTVAETGAGYVQLSWDPCEDNIMQPGYGVKYEVTANGSTNTVTDTTFTITGLLCGTEYDITVAAVDAAGNSIATAIKVSTTECIQEPYDGVDHKIPGMIEMEHYDKGGLYIAYFDTDGKKGDATFREFDIVDVVASRDTADQYSGKDLTVVKPGEWLEYTLSSVTAGTYRIEIRYATSISRGSVIVKLINGTDTAELATLPIKTSGGFLTYDYLVAEDISIAASTDAILRVEFESDRFSDMANFNFIKFVETTALRNANVNALNVYPNPSNKGFNVDLSSIQGKAQLEIFDLSGRMIYNEVENGGTQVHLNSGVFTQTGMYLLKVKSSNGISVARLIVE